MNSNQEFVEFDTFIAEIIRTDRSKSADIRVEEGMVSVVVPKVLTLERIHEILTKKDSWIKSKMQLQRQAAPPARKQYVSGEAFSYLGRNYRLKIVRGPFTPAKLKEGRLIVTVSEGIIYPYMIRNSLARWYKNRALTKLSDKVKRYASAVGVTPGTVSVKTFKRRWGSCTTKGDLEFNWKIMMAPNSIVDYVVVHELCHLIRHDHSPAFWYQVERVMPDYMARKDALKAGAVKFELS